jgi:hypothetical protein
MDEFGFACVGRCTQAAEKIKRGWQSELRCSESCDEIAAANATTFFESLENVVHSTEATGDIFRGYMLAHENAVAMEQLLG